MSSGPNLDLKRQVKDAVDIVKYLEGEHQLRRQGANYVCHCPWHDDQRPSLQINPVKQTWRCWPCEIGGDIFSYVMKREGLEFREALLHLAEYANIPVTQSQPKFQPGSPQDKQTLFKASAWAQQEFHRCLLETDAAALARDYLADRGITDESIEEFKLGFAPASFTWLVDRARKTDFTPEILEACGLVVQNDRGWYERFRGRLIFPILDTSQRVIALGGRVVPGVFPEGQEPPAKYINSPETRLFSKSETLFGLNMVRDKVAKTRSLTVVEGYTDVIAAWQVGLRNVVACLGVALNEKHIRIIKRFADEITLVLDGDAAGQKRSNEILDLFVDQEIGLRIMTLPEGADPFDFLMQNGNEAFASLVAAAPDAMEHKIRSVTAGIDLINDTHGANQALESILATLAKAHGSGSAAKMLRQDQVLTRVARKFQLDLAQIRRRLIELRSSTRRNYLPASRPPAAPDETVNFARFDAKELELLEIVIDEPTLVDTAIENVVPGQFGPGPLRDLFEHIVKLFQAGEEISFELLMLQIEKPYLKNVVAFLGEEAEQKRLAMQSRWSDITDPATQLYAIIQAFNDVVAESGKRATISKLQQNELDEQEKAATLEELFQKMKQRQGL